MLKIAREHPKVLFYPEPTAYFVNFGASSLDLILRFWVREYNDGLAITSDIRMKINDVFAAEGIEISFPQLDVHMRSDEDISAALERSGTEGASGRENNDGTEEKA